MLSCPVRIGTTSRQGSGLSLRERRGWTMGACPGSGSSSYHTRCSTLTMDCSSTLQGIDTCSQLVAALDNRVPG